MVSPVLVLGAEPRVAVAIARSLNRHGIPVDVAALSREKVRLSSRAIRTYVCLPDHKDRAHDFVTALLRLIDSNRYSLLMPCSDTALTEVVRYYDRVASRVTVGSPKPEIIRRVLNKNETLTYAQKCGIPVPESYHFTSLSELKAARDSLRYPMIAKPLDKRQPSSFKVKYFHEFKEIEDAFRSDPLFGTHTLLQEYCDGEGVGIGTYVHKGAPIAIYQHRRLKEYPHTGGVSVLAVSEEPDPLLVRYAVRLLNAVEWEGAALVEFRFDRQERRATLMEINGRYWGSLASAIHAGVDFPFYEWQLVHQKRHPAPKGYKTGLRVRWIAGDLRRLHDLLTRRNPDPAAHRARRAEVARFFTDFRPSIRHMLWSYSDPLPAVVEIFYVLKALLLKDTKALIRAVMPIRLHTHLKTLRNLDHLEKLVYGVTTLKRIVRISQMSLAKGAKKPARILFLCHGNIIRSPMAEALFNQKASKLGLKHVQAMSAGIYAKQGNSADPRSITVAQEFGICLKDHRARPINQKMVDEADAVFVMDSLNEAGLLDSYPKAWKKLYLLGSLKSNGDIKKKDIQDPYNGEIDDVRRCYEILESAVQNLVSTIAESSR